MVSTRGAKIKFVEGERVLCYEPDPTKAKVLYDSKVLDIILKKDQRGRKTIEYLIHFQGWNSSWDRCVCEEFVLKDTPENRQLQRDLAEKSQLQLGAYLYRRERKKLSTKNENATTGQFSEEGSLSSPPRMDSDESTTDDDSSTEGENIPIELTPILKKLLETDYNLINTNNMLHNLPATPNIVTILETYYKHFSNQLYSYNEKNGSRFKNSSHVQKPSKESIEKRLSSCGEFLDGLRIYFDSIVNTNLLYTKEKNVFLTRQLIYPSIAHMNQTKETNSGSNTRADNEENGSQNCIPDERDEGTSRKRSLRSYVQPDPTQTNGSSLSSLADGTNSNYKSCPSISSENSEASAPAYTARSVTWKLLPDFAYNQQPPAPCLAYGATHLTRLLVKLPEYLGLVNMPEPKLKSILKHMDLFIDFLSEHEEWFGEHCYQVVQ